MPTVIAGDRLLTPKGLVDGGWVEIDGERVVGRGPGSPPSAEVQKVRGIVSPGFVDVHTHGGGGTNFGEGPDAATVVLATHLAHGTTTMIASLVTGKLDHLEATVRALTPMVAAGDLAGIHLEGPWLAREYKGAHTESLLVDPVLADVQRLVQAGPVRMVTMAPERPGALEAIAWMASRGVIVAVGHTAADDACARQAIAAGATGATHLFNAMPEILHRAPGPVLALWQTPHVWVELVCDGAHVAADLVAHVMTTKPKRCVFVTDAMAATGVGDGQYSLGGLDVTVKGGVAHLTGTNTIAGSTLTLDRAVQVAVAAGVPTELALLAATAHPADYLGLSQVGRLDAGRFADLVVLDDDLQVTKVMRHGRWVG